MVTRENMGFPCGSPGKESTCSVGDLGLYLGTDLEIVIVSEVRQRKTNIIRDHFYVKSRKKNDTKKLFNKTDSETCQQRFV